MLRIYTASKLYMWEVWRELRFQVVDVEFTARWVDMAHVEINAEQTGAFYEKCWLMDIADIQRADVVLVYGGKEDVLVGALVEAGAGIAMGKTIICVGDSKSFGSWKHHPSVHAANSVIDAIRLARKLLG